jgi:hypothetical protein
MVTSCHPLPSESCLIYSSSSTIILQKVNCCEHLYLGRVIVNIRFSNYKICAREVHITCLGGCRVRLLTYQDALPGRVDGRHKTEFNLYLCEHHRRGHDRSQQQQHKRQGQHPYSSRTYVRTESVGGMEQRYSSRLIINQVICDISKLSGYRQRKSSGYSFFDADFGRWRRAGLEMTPIMQRRTV